ncbi:MAG TPA: penicillin acylase family protein [Candidatus Methylomirabilis sp.]|nr:penicillin acylase family protein [Candidatus Methylomirabilis sp.]
MRTIFRILIWTFTILLVAAAILSWWFVYRPLPQLDGTLSVPGLRQPVAVDRDNWGIPRIRAASLEDAVEAQGYVMAQDRLWQLDLMRRVSRGQLAEIVGPPALASDEKFRTFGFSRIADRELANTDKDYRSLLEAYARGVNAFIAQHQDNLPFEFKLLNYKPTPWLPTDSLVIAGYMYQTLTDTWERELDRAAVEARVGPERSKDLFSGEAQMDHFVIGDPNVPNDGSRSSQLDLDDDDSDDGVIKTSLFPFASPAIPAPDSLPDLTSALWPSIQSRLAGVQSEIRQSLGSNNWVVRGERTATGKPILANDTHLELTIPPIWYEIHLTAPNYNAKGFTLPGAPLIVIGHNNRIAWDFTNNGADVQDLYIETFNPAAPNQYKVNGQWQRAQIFDELIHVKDRPDVHLPVVVTRHGPLVYPGGIPGAILTGSHDAPTPSDLRRDAYTAYALKWTALEPGGLSNTYSTLSLANNWHEFRDIMKNVWGPAQNTVYADVDGNIGYIMAARVPLRKKGRGEVPVPGNTNDYEWTGYIPFDQLPQALNPESGLIVTANARVVGPDYKPYLTDRWEEPYRTSRIHDLLYDKSGLRPIDMLKVETDTYSYPELFLSEQLSAVAKITQPKDPRARQLMQEAKDFSGMADADSPVVSFLVAIRRAALDLILEPYLGKDTNLYRWRSMAFLQKILTDRPAKWLPPAYKSYDELLAAAADRAVTDLSQEAHSDSIRDWQWKRFDSLDMLHPLGRAGFLKWLLSISGKPQSGTGYSVRAATPRHGPSMRFIANLANWDDSIMLIPAGESGQLGSSHYTDQFSYWYEGKPIVTPYSDPAESHSRKHTLTLTP